MALVLNLQESTTTPPTPQTNHQPTSNIQQPTSNNQQPKNNNQKPPTHNHHQDQDQDQDKHQQQQQQQQQQRQRQRQRQQQQQQQTSIINTTHSLEPSLCWPIGLGLFQHEPMRWSCLGVCREAWNQKSSRKLLNAQFLSHKMGPYDRYKWSYGPFKRPYKWGTVFFSPLLGGSHFAEILQIFQAKPSNSWCFVFFLI